MRASHENSGEISGDGQANASVGAGCRSVRDA